MDPPGRYGETSADHFTTFVNTYFNSLWPLLGLVLLALGLYGIWTRVQLHLVRKEFMAKHGCRPPAVTMPDDIFGVGFLLRLIERNRKHAVLAFFHDLFKQYGRTFMKKSLRKTVVFTNDSENIKCLLSTRMDDWGVKDLRQEGVRDILGDGIFTTDGAFWAHSRFIIRPAFEKSQALDLEPFEERIGALLAQIPDDGSTVDLQELFHRFTMDTSSELLTGQSTNSLEGNNKEALQFIENFEYAMQDCSTRTRLGPLYHLFPHPRAQRAIRAARKFVDNYVEHAMEIKHSLDVGDDKPKSKRDRGKFVFLDELAKHDDVDATRIRNETMNVLLAGRDTTAILLSSLWFVLARQSEVWTKLQAEVDELNGELPTYEQLRNMNYLKYCVQEALRLYTPVAMLGKTALCDTMLPRGGGPDGSQPLFIAKGTIVPYNLYSMHRQPSTYGPDAESFNPDRWADPGFRPGWDYLPFGGGPRVCLGQQYALTETYYVTIRLMQHFRKVEARDSEPWIEKLSATCSSWNGTKVALLP